MFEIIYQMKLKRIFKSHLFIWKGQVISNRRDFFFINIIA